MVGEGKRRLADDLARFMTFAGDDQNIPRHQHPNRLADRPSAVTDLEMSCFDGRYIAGRVDDEYLRWVEETTKS